MAILPYDETPPKVNVPTTNTGSMAGSLGAFRQGVDLTTDEAMYSNFAKIHGNGAGETEQLTFGAGTDVKETVLFKDDNTYYSPTDYINS